MKISLVSLILLTMFITGCNCSVMPEEPTSQLPTLEPTAPESSAEYALQLAERFCPVIHLNGEVEARENFEPDPVQLMVELSLLKELGNPEFSEKPSIIDLQRWAQCVYYLDVANLDPKTNTLGEYKAVYEPVKVSYHPTIYARVKEGTDHTVLQYWLFYYFNDWRNFHEGDWELVQLNFAGYTAKELMESERLPVFAAYSQHQAGQRMSWNDMRAEGMVMYETHPIVYVAKGSHANYFAPGQFWSGLDFDNTGVSLWRIIAPEEVDIVLLHREEKEGKEWLDFQGYWGKYLGFSVSVLGLRFQQCGPFGPQWSDGGEVSRKWEQPEAWAGELPEYPKPFWTSFIDKIGDWTKNAIFSLFSPADLHVYDSLGRHVGLDERGVLEIDIPGAIYITPEGTDYKTIIIPDADVANEYRVEVKGTGSGIMDLKVQVPDAENKVTRYLEYTDVPISTTAIAQLSITKELPQFAVPSRPTLTMRDITTRLEIDSDGDGFLDLESKPGIFENKEIDTFSLWWEEYREPFILNTSGYPAFLRGAWASRIDEARSYLINAEQLRGAGFDTVMLGVDIVFDPETGEPKSLGDDVFIFYLQALKKAGFRVVLIPNPMHPNLDMGRGYEWDESDIKASYNRSYALLKSCDPVVIKWAKIAQEYQVDGFAPLNEPYKLVWDYNDASRWLQEILPQIKQVYDGKVLAVDTMYDTGQGLSVPYPYNYRGYDLILGGPPAGQKDVPYWEEMIGMYINEGIAYAREYKLEGFGLYEWGGYTGGAWYEDEQMAVFDQVLTQEQARQIIEAGIRQAEGRIVASFPRISIGWVDFDTPAFKSLAEWYSKLGKSVGPLEDKQWTYDELIMLEKKLAGDDYKDIFQLEDGTADK